MTASCALSRHRILKVPEGGAKGQHRWRGTSFGCKRDQSVGFRVWGGAVREERRWQLVFYDK